MSRVSFCCWIINPKFPTTKKSCSNESSNWKAWPQKSPPLHPGSFEHVSRWGSLPLRCRKWQRLVRWRQTSLLTLDWHPILWYPSGLCVGLLCTSVGDFCDFVPLLWRHDGCFEVTLPINSLSKAGSFSLSHPSAFALAQLDFDRKTEKDSSANRSRPQGLAKQRYN